MSESGASFGLRIGRNSELIGIALLRNYSPENGRGEAEIWIAPQFRGLGYAHRGLRLLTRWAFSNLSDLHRLSLYIDADHDASARLANKAGYRYEGRLRSWTTNSSGSRSDQLIYGFTFDDYQRLLANGTGQLISRVQTGDPLEPEP